MRKLPQFYYEQYGLGEAPEPIKKLLQEDSNLEAITEKLRLESQDFLAIHPLWTLNKLRPLVSQGQKKLRTSWIQKLGLPSKLAAVATGLVFLLGFGVLFPLLSPDSLEDTRVKGGQTSLVLYKQELEGSSILHPRAVVAPYENIQIAYKSGSKKFGMIFSIDGLARLTLHHPESYQSRPLLSPGNQVILPFAYQLDDAPGVERFYFVSTDVEFSVISWMQTLENVLASPTNKNSPWETELNLPRDWEITTFDVVKGDAQ